MKFEFVSQALNAISTDCLVIFAFQEDNKKKPSFVAFNSFSEIDEILKGKLSRIAKIDSFTGKRGEVLLCIPDDSFLASRICVLGLGKKNEFVLDDLRRAIGGLTKKHKGKIDSISIILPLKNEWLIDVEAATYTISEAIVLANYQFMRYREKGENERELSTVMFVEKDKTVQKRMQSEIEKARVFSEATIVARDLVNEQSAIATPIFLANLAKEIAKSSPQISCKVFDKDQVEKMGMQAFLGIARGSDIPPKFIHLEYTPKGDKSKKKLALVGKGITFDSGGFSLKPADYMTDMKCDMSGAALVLGVFSVIEKVKPKFKVLGLIAATPNLVSGSAIVPGDVVRAMNGKTIEVLNTDAEGRVTMADSLSYAVKEGATEIIDFATLTGACMVALGHDIAGLFSNNKELTDLVKSAAHDAGEKVWELPLEKDYKDLNKSDVADIANISKTRYGGAITAGLFLEAFVADKPWVHLDIAGPAFSDKPSDISQKGGTGFGVRTVLNLLQMTDNS